jgi:hypothetical protein
MVAGITQVNLQVPAGKYPASGSSVSVNSAAAALYVVP